MSKQPGPPSLSEVQAELARRSLAHFVRYQWAVLEPKDPLVWNWHLDTICEHVQACLEGRLTGSHLIVNVPPGSMKSRIVSVCTLPWMWLQDPTWSGIYTSGNPRIAVRDSLNARDLVSSEWYRRTFRPEWKLARDQNEKLLFKNTAGGWRQAYGTGAKVIGDRANGLFIDDPHDAATVHSDAERNGVIVWHDQGFYNRVKDPERAPRILIMQRLHEADLAGALIAKGGVDRLVIRTEYEAPREKDPDPIGPTALGWVDPRTEEGALMFPARFSAAAVAKEKLMLGDGYVGQHQQRPTKVGGQILKRDKWQYVGPFAEELTRVALRLLEVDRIVFGVDTALTEEKSSDYSAVCVLGVARTRFIVLEIWKERVEVPELKVQIEALAAKWKPQAIVIEGGGSASGKATVQMLRKGAPLPLIEISHIVDKVARINFIAPLQVAGTCALIAGAPWLAAFLDSTASFPRAPHDDDVDAFAIALRFAAYESGGLAILDHYRQMAEKGLAVASAAPVLGTVPSETGSVAVMEPGTAIMRMGPPKPK